MTSLLTFAYTYNCGHELFSLCRLIDIVLRKAAGGGIATKERKANAREVKLYMFCLEIFQVDPFQQSFSQLPFHKNKKLAKMYPSFYTIL